MEFFLKSNLSKIWFPTTLISAKNALKLIGWKIWAFEIFEKKFDIFETIKLIVQIPVSF